jgi:hypothetical protein
MFTQPPFRHQKHQRGDTDWRRTRAQLEILAYSLSAQAWGKRVIEELGKLLAPTMKALAEFAANYQALLDENPRQD